MSEWSLSQSEADLTKFIYFEVTALLCHSRRYHIYFMHPTHGYIDSSLTDRVSSELGQPSRNRTLGFRW